MSVAVDVAPGCKPTSGGGGVCVTGSCVVVVVFAACVVSALRVAADSKMSDMEKQRFHEIAEQDNNQYENNMHNYVPLKGEEIKGQIRDPNIPKRSLSAFFWFTNDERSKVRADYPEYSIGDIAIELGRRWVACNSETKSKYEAIAEKDKARYDKEMMAYEKRPTMEIPMTLEHLDLGKEEDEEYESVTGPGFEDEGATRH